MFICRQQLLRAFTPRQTLRSNALLRYVKTLTPAPACDTNLRHGGHSSDTPATASRAEALTTSPNTLRGSDTLHSLSKTPELSYSSSWQTESITNDTNDPAHPTPSVAAHDVPNTTHTPAAESVIDILRNALGERDSKAVDRMVDDILALETDRVGRDTLLQQALHLLVTSPFTHKRALLRVLQALQCATSPSEVPFVLQAQAAECFATPLSTRSFDTPALAILAPIITDYVLRISGDHRLVQQPYTPSHVLWLQFKILLKQVKIGQEKAALQSLRQLVQYRVIPSSALTGIELATQDFGTILRTILVRCCISFNWPNRGAFLLNSHMEWNEHTPQSFASAVTGIIDLLIKDDTSESSVRTVAGLLTRYHQFLSFRFPRKLLQRFYDRAARDREDAIALTVYRLIRSPDVLAKNGSSRLRTDALSWLLRRGHARKDVQAIRALVTQVADEELDLSEPALCSFVRVAAESGMLSAARKLWERGAAAGCELVTRDPGILTRLVSLLQARIRNHARHLKESRRKYAPHKETTVPGDAMELEDSLLASDARDPNALYASDLDSAGQGDETGKGRSPSVYQEEIDEYRAFTDRVIDTFVRHNTPLRDATREQLNALARAYVIQGRHEEGAQVLQIVLDRQETPDIYDVNVALSAVSMKDAATGAKVLEQMTSSGLQPDSVSFGTVINHAALQGNMSLVNELLARARHAGISELDYKTTGRLIRLYAQSPTYGGLSLRNRLRRVKKLIESLLDAGFLPSSNMGLDCVDLALHAGEPVIAYDFWMLLVKAKVQWDDGTQAHYRWRIAGGLRQHFLKGLVEPTAARLMLLDLGHISWASQIARTISTSGPAATQEVAAGPVQHSRRATDSKGPVQ